jgi:methylenetetrahydrofolate dehydrogenase (NADP+)/methenyltetrahydrofolate cyclohydrolase
VTARSIDGTAVARKVREDVAHGVEKLLAEGGVAPGLATVLIGEDPASEVYVRNKRRLSVEAGMQDRTATCPATSTRPPWPR